VHIVISYQDKNLRTLYIKRRRIAKMHSFACHGTPSQSNSSLLSAWYRYEAARSFDLDDDLEFCPGLLSDDEMQLISIVYSDRSSSSSGSPDSSPLQMQIRPSSSSPSPYFSSQSTSPSNSFNANTKQHHVSSTSRQRNAIPIVNPHTGMRVSSPPLPPNAPGSPSDSPQLARRQWWIKNSIESFSGKLHGVLGRKWKASSWYEMGTKKKSNIQLLPLSLSRTQTLSP